MQSSSDINEISIGEIFSSVRNHWWLLLLSAFLGAAIALGASFFKKPVYRAYAVASYIGNADSKQELSAIAGQLGGLASLAGLPLQEDTRKAEALAFLRSRELILKFIEVEGIEKGLFGDRYAEELGGWTDEGPPTDWEKVERFHEDVLTISEDPKSGLITVSVTWNSRKDAADWANSLIRLADNALREKDLKEVHRSIDFLNKELEKTSVVGVTQAIFRLIETQLNKAMLANIRDEYVFKVIDGAMVPDEDEVHAPVRILWMLFGVVVGSTIGLLVVVRRS